MQSFLVFLVSLSAAAGNSQGGVPQSEVPQDEVKPLNDDPENSKQVLIGKQELIKKMLRLFVFFSGE